MKYYYLFFLVSFSVSAQDLNVSFLTIDKELTKNANSVIRSDTYKVDVSKDDVVVLNRTRILTILNENGNNKVDSYINYDAQTQVNKLEMYIYDALGNEIEKFKKRDFQDISAADGYSLYSDDRILYVNYVPKAYPYTIKFITEVKSNTSAFLPRWLPLRGFASSTANSEFIVDFNQANKPNFKVQNLEGYEISIEETPNQIICKATNLKAIPYEEQSPSFDDFAPHAKFALKKFSLQGVTGFGNSWEEFGKWMDERLLKDVKQLSPSTIAKVKAMVVNETSNLDKARVIYQYLQDKVRYISVQIGIGGWKPMKADDVDRLSYGDCKALTNYTKALLDAVGVPSYYTILHTGKEEEDISKDFVAMQGNHAILGVPNGEDIVWLECTSQDIPFGHVGNTNDDRDVLIVKDNGGEIVHTKKYTASENLQKTNAEIVIDYDGGFKASLDRTSQGLQYDFVYYLPKKTDDEKESHYKEKWSQINGLEIKSIELVNDRKAITFTEKITVNSANYTSKIGDDILLKLNAFNQVSYIPPRLSNRNLDLEISLAYTDVDTYTFKIPEGYKLESIPEDKKIESDFGTYSMTIKAAGTDTLVYERTLLMKKEKYPASKYEAYRNFYKAISKLDKIKVLLTKI